MMNSFSDFMYEPARIQLASSNKLNMGPAYQIALTRSDRFG
jgi:hypothetical protein